MAYRACIWALGSILMGVPAYSQNIGLAVNGNCVAGPCPAKSLGFSATANLPISTNVTLANGDIYSITGTLTSSNDADGGNVALTYLFQAIYAGNGSGGPAQEDKLTIDVYPAYQTASGTGNFVETLAGSFSQNIARGSEVQVCTAGLCTSSAISPGSFDVTSPFTLASSAGVFSLDYTFTATFGAGSPVGSYILFSFPSTPPPGIQAAISAGAFGAFSSIAPGSWIEIYGTNLSVGPRTWGSIDFTGPNAPTTLGGTSVSIGGKAAFVDYVSPGQVNVQVPAGLNTGSQPLIVTTARGSSHAYTTTVNATEPGLLAPVSFHIVGTQYVVALSSQNTYILPPGSIAGLATGRAKPGDTITLYGVGFGSVNPDTPPGQIAEAGTTLATGFSIYFGGTLATSVPYAGLAPGYVGLYQFNVVVPDVTASDQVPLTFNLGGTASTQTLYIAVGD